MKDTQTRVENLINTDRCPACLGLQGHYHHKDGEKKWIPCKLCKGTGKKRSL